MGPPGHHDHDIRRTASWRVNWEAAQTRPRQARGSQAPSRTGRPSLAALASCERQAAEDSVRFRTDPSRPVTAAVGRAWGRAPDWGGGRSRETPAFPKDSDLLEEIRAARRQAGAMGGRTAADRPLGRRNRPETWTAAKTEQPLTFLCNLPLRADQTRNSTFQSRGASEMVTRGRHVEQTQAIVRHLACRHARPMARARRRRKILLASGATNPAGEVSQTNVNLK